MQNQDSKSLMKRYPQFARLWLASATSNLGDGIFMVAFPLIATTLTRSPTLIASLTSLMVFPWLILAPFSGVVADRWERKRLMIWANTIRGLIGLAIILLIATNQISLSILFGCALILGCLEVLSDTTAGSLLPQIIPASQLEWANGKLAVAERLPNDFIGKPLGGILFRITTFLPFLFFSGLLMISVFALSHIKTLKHIDNLPIQNTTSSFWQSTKQGFNWYWKHNTLRRVSLLIALRNLIDSGSYAILVLFALETLKAGEEGYSILITLAAIGSLLGAFWSDSITKQMNIGMTIICCFLLSSVSFLAIPLCKNFYITGFSLAIISFSEVIRVIIVKSLRQRITPLNIQGRANGIHRFMTRGSRFFGSLLGGIVGSTYGISVPFLIAGWGTALLTIYCVILFKDNVFGVDTIEYVLE